jgi:hypothetical protein
MGGIYKVSKEEMEVQENIVTIEKCLIESIQNISGIEKFDMGWPEIAITHLQEGIMALSRSASHYFVDLRNKEATNEPVIES